MASRFALYTTSDLRDRFSLESGLPKGIKPSYNISPGDTPPIIHLHEGVRTLTPAIWGFVPATAKNTNSIFRYKTFNARSEGIFSKPTWQTAIRTKRCIIPANGFYEWKLLNGTKQAYFIQSADTPLFGFAGVYSSWTNPEGETKTIFSLVTTLSDDDTGNIPQRLPVILDQADEAVWLDQEVDDANVLYKIMRPLPAERLHFTRVSDAINSKKINNPSLIQPALKPN